MGVGCARGGADPFCMLSATDCCLPNQLADQIIALGPIHSVAAGGNKSAHSSTGANLKKLEDETEDFHGALAGLVGRWDV